MATLLYAAFSRPVELAGLQDGLARYKYVSPNESLAEKLFLNDFWTWVASHYPMWLAPNLITTIGFIAQIAATLILLYYSPLLDGSAPSWWLPVSAFAGFLYQTMDGTDGKQARRTKSGSPMGELWDHGVDALSTSLYVLSMLEWSEYGSDHPAAIACVLMGQACFAFQSIEMHHTDRFQFDLFDAQESQLVVQAALLAKWFYPNIPTWPVPAPAAMASVFRPLYSAMGFALDEQGRLNVCQWLCVLANAGLLASTVRTTARILRYHYSPSSERRAQEKIKEGQTLPALWHQYSIFVLFFLFSYLSSLEIGLAVKAGLGRYHTTLFLLFVSVAFGSLMWRFLVQRIAGVPFPSPRRQPALVALFGYWASLTFLNLGRPQAQGLVCVAWMSFALISFLTYTRRMVTGICKVLNIHFFDITRKRRS